MDDSAKEHGRLVGDVNVSVSSTGVHTGEWCMGSVSVAVYGGRPGILVSPGTTLGVPNSSSEGGVVVKTSFESHPAMPGPGGGHLV